MQRDIPQNWPNREASRIVRGPVHEWHVQEAGSGTPILMLHGAGGSVHSFGDLFANLAQDHHVLAPDLPGHGFTRLGSQRRSNLDAMATDIATLCQNQGFAPRFILGHSAGGAIALQMARNRPQIHIIGINPALDNFEGLAGVIFPAMAKILAAVPFVPRLFSGVSGRPERVRALIDSTGSKLSPEGLALYGQLISHEGHVNGALSMMAQWALDDLLLSLPEIEARTLFITGENDRTVPPRVAQQAAKRMQNAQIKALPELGHLIHEEAPEEVADLCRAFVAQN